MGGNLRGKGVSGLFWLLSPELGRHLFKDPSPPSFTPSFVADSQVPPLGWRLANEVTHQEDVAYFSLCGMLDSSMDEFV